ncbi:hypothetical protein Trydic_g1751 [Trypoxylus dichotomus]
MNNCLPWVEFDCYINQLSRYKTAFTTPTYEFMKMSFRFVNGPTVYQRLFIGILHLLRFTTVIAYINGTSVGTVSKELAYHKAAELQPRENKLVGVRNYLAPSIQTALRQFLEHSRYFR